MKYEILVEGGFTGIPKKYEGEIDLPSEEINTLINLMKGATKVNENLRDGKIYNVEIGYTNNVFRAVFSDKNIPAAIRKIVAGGL